MQYIDLVKVYENISSSSKRLAKTYEISKILKKTPESELKILIPLLQGKIFPDWEETKIGVSTRLILKSLSIASGNPIDKIETQWKKLGDLGLVATKLIHKKKQSTLFQESLSIKKVYDNIVKLAKLEGQGSTDQKVKLVAELLTSATPDEAKYIIRTVLEELRVGVGDSSIRDAIVWAYFPELKVDYDPEKNVITFEGPYKETIEALQHAYDVTNDFPLVAQKAKTEKSEGIRKLNFALGTPIKVMLYPKAADINDAFDRVGKPCAFEYKYDGFRVQIHKVSDDNILIFTRRLDNVTKQFPEIMKLVKTNIKADNFIIDCEAVGFDKSSKKYLPFQKISQRIKRKHNILETAKNFPVELNIFDIIYYNSDSLLKSPFEKRRKIIEKITKQEKLKIVCASQIITDSPEKAEQFYQQSLKAGNEGIMAKRLDAIYKPGSRVGYGMKIKPVMESLDLVITEAEWGTGKRAGWLTSFTIACIDEDNNILDIGKVGTGFKEKESENVDGSGDINLTFEHLTTLLKPLILSEVGKIVKLKPKIIIEISYEEIQKSPTYSSGFALRFPRLLKLREDKSLDEISSLNYIEDLYYDQRSR